MGVKYPWWGYVKNMIRAYPLRAAQYEDILRMNVTPSLSGMPHASGPGDPVSEVLIGAEGKASYHEYWAVKKALKTCGTIAPEFCQFVRLYYWTQPRIQLERIADRLNYSPETIRRWNKRFIYTVAKERGLYDG